MLELVKPIAVIDFETTGLSPTMGDRATEIAIVMLEGDRVVDRFQSLMNAGVRIPAFIEAYTGISNAMIARRAAGGDRDGRRGALRRRCADGGAQRLVRPPLLGSGAADGGPQARHPFACTLLLSRRLYPQAPNHKLGSLAAFHALPSSGRAHRAMADAEVAAALLGQIRHDLRRQYGVGECRHDLLVKVQKSARAAVPKVIEKYLQAAQAPAT